MAKSRKVTLKEALRLNIDDMLKLKRKDLAEAYEKVRATVQRRPTAPKKLRQQMKAASSFRNKREMSRALFRAQLFLASPEATVKGKKERLREVREMMERKTGIRFRSMKDVERFKEYMDDVAKMFPDKYKLYYTKLVELYRTMTEQHISMEQSTFLFNFEYWIENIDTIRAKFERMSAKDRRRINTPEKVVRDLDLPSVEGFYLDRAKVRRYEDE